MTEHRWYKISEQDNGLWRIDVSTGVSVSNIATEAEARNRASDIEWDYRKQEVELG